MVGRPRFIGFLGFLALVGVASSADANQFTNGRYVNGRYVNGRYVNSAFTNGRYVNSAYANGGTVGGLSIASVTKGGRSVSNVHLEASELVGSTLEPFAARKSRWVTRRADWFVGTIFGATLLDVPTGALAPVRLRIDNLEWVTDAKLASGLLRANYSQYQVSIEVPADGGTPAHWEPLCGRDDNQTPIAAIPLQGEWNYAEGDANGGAHVSADPNRLTFACTNYALGKCAGRVNYPPWETDYVETCSAGGTCRWVNRNLADVHQACTRMVRADYCGDGVSNTVDGTPIDVFDDVGGEPAPPGGGFWVQTRRNAPSVSLPSSTWRFEATWASDGATGYECERHNTNPVSCPVYEVPITVGRFNRPVGTIRKQHVPIYECFVTGSDATRALVDDRAVIGNLREQTPARWPLVPNLPVIPRPILNIAPVHQVSLAR